MRLVFGPNDECATIPGSVATFVAFLGDLVALAAEMTDGFAAAMGDPSTFGTAKSLFASAAADGVDMADADGLQEWIADFNARPEDDRRRVIPDTSLAAPSRPAMPPVVPPDEADVAASQAAAPILAKFAALAEFVGAGRKLTKTGNFTLADARCWSACSTPATSWTPRSANVRSGPRAPVS